MVHSILGGEIHNAHQMKNQSSEQPSNNSSEDHMRVVILNQYYVPDVASTGHLLFELAENLAAQGADVTVLTCRPSYGPKETWQKCPRTEFKNGVHVKRLWSTRFSKDSIFGRVLNSVTFLVPLALIHVLPRRKGEVFLYTTNPPYLGFVGAVAYNYAGSVDEDSFQEESLTAPALASEHDALQLCCIQNSQFGLARYERTG